MKRSSYVSITVAVIFFSLFFLTPGARADTCTSGQRTINFTNNCAYPVWVGATQTGSTVAMPSWKWKVTAGGTESLCLPNVWSSGNFWARTGCQFDSTTLNYPSCSTNADCTTPTGSTLTAACYNGVCVGRGCVGDADCATYIGTTAGDGLTPICYAHTVNSATVNDCILTTACDMGDCNGGLQCPSGGSPPTTLAEFTLGAGTGSTVDNYDLSSVNGMGVSVEITPTLNSCNQLGCTQTATDCPAPCAWDANANCPAELQILSGSTVVGCLAPQKYCGNAPGCFATGTACATNSQCCSGTCASGTCATNSLNCTSVYGIGAISCATAKDCPVVSNIPCASSAVCPTGTTCQTINGENLCAMNCVSGSCKSVACASDADCTQPACVGQQCTDTGAACTLATDCANYTKNALLLGQSLGCDLAAGSPTVNTCQPTANSMYGCVGINHTSCKGTGSYGAKATWCCGCSTWQDAAGECQARNPNWRAVAEPFVQVFHNACATSYSFPYDDSVDESCTLGSTTGAGYNITFCPSAGPAKNYVLTVNITGATYGKVVSSPSGISCASSSCQHSFASGLSVTLTATPNKGYAVNGWTGCASVSGATCTVAMSGAKSVTAVFTPPPAITASPGSINFGQVKKGVVSATKTVTVKNTGKGQLQVSSATIGGSTEFSVTNGCSSALDTGETCLVTVGVLATAYGTQSGKLLITSNDPKKPTATISLTANAKPPVMSVSPTALNFGAVATGIASNKYITIKNTGVSDLIISAISTPADTSFTVDSACLTTLAQNATCKMTVTFDPATKGAKTSQFTVTPNAGTTPTIKLSGSGK
jgi:hypothetical protein